jgi:hypothetical protein
MIADLVSRNGGPARQPNFDTPAMGAAANSVSDGGRDIAKWIPDLLKQHAAGGAEGK